MAYQGTPEAKHDIALSLLLRTPVEEWACHDKSPIHSLFQIESSSMLASKGSGDEVLAMTSQRCLGEHGSASTFFTQYRIRCLSLRSEGQVIHPKRMSSMMSVTQRWLDMHLQWRMMGWSPNIHYLAFDDHVRRVCKSYIYKVTSSLALHSSSMWDLYLNNLRMCALLGRAYRGDMQATIFYHTDHYFEGNRYSPIKSFFETL